MAGSLLIATIIAIVCLSIQPNLDDRITNTTGNVFRQQRNTSWVHSGHKVEKLKDGWFVEGNDRNVAEAATETDGDYSTITKETRDNGKGDFCPRRMDRWSNFSTYTEAIYKSLNWQCQLISIHVYF